MQRFWSKVDVRGPEECWPWQAGLREGYGWFSADIDGKYRPHRAHRVAYFLTFGLPEEAVHVDHTCHNGSGCEGGVGCPHRRCCNPAHLESVPAVQNKARGQSRNAINARKTHCIRGHEFTPANTITRPLGRECRTCHNADTRAAAARRKARLTE